MYTQGDALSAIDQWHDHSLVVLPVLVTGPRHVPSVVASPLPEPLPQAPTAPTIDLLV